MFHYQDLINKYYPQGSPLRVIYITHCRKVAELALHIARAKQLPLDPDEIEAAAMLHDIGIFLTNAPGIECHGTEPYLAHGALGADLLRRHGAPEFLPLVAERHTGSGLSPQDIAQNNLPLPPGRSYLPQSLLERLICYADKFYSKSGDPTQQKSLDRVRASQARFGPHVLRRFDLLHNEFAL